MQPFQMLAQRCYRRAIPLCRRIQARLIIGSLAVLAVFLGPIGAGAQGQSTYTRGNSWTLFSEYAPNSSHIFWGVSEKRQRLAFGGEYGRRLVRGHGLEFDCMFQAKPVALERDPTLAGFRNVSTGQILVRIEQPTRVVIVNNSTFLLPGVGQIAPVYGGEWTYGFEIDPIGLKLNFRARRPLQPFIDTTGGLIVTTRDIPIDQASSFNYEFGFGAGFDYFLSARRSLRFGYAFRHISNNGISAVNPGIDAGVIEIGYSFGR
ncbi:MAG TPA: acyloxyacyl hydrolase [Candidatus Acidoferrales bacterium]